MSKCGEVVKITIVKEPFTKESRGFGFVQFSDSNMAKKALNTF